MPNTFKNYTKDGSAVAASTNMDVYTVPGSTTATVIGLDSRKHHDIADHGRREADHIERRRHLHLEGSTSASPIVPIGGDQKLVMETGDILRVISSAANSADSTVSVLEIS